MTMLPSLTQQDFVAKWRAAQLSERSAYQQHFLDLCRLIGHPTPAELDPTGASFTFEAGLKQIGGQQGWADVWKKGVFALEYKGKHANLDKAYQQLLLYREALQNPPLLVVCDIDTIIIHTNFTNTVKRTMTISLAEMVKPEALTWLRAMFLEPERFRLAQTTQQVTEAAAREFAKVAEILRKYGDPPPVIAHFCIQLLFCLFAEDIRLLPDNLFTNLVNRLRPQPQLFSRQLKQLFGEMTGGGMFGDEFVPHINGRLFEGDTILTVDRDVLDLLQKAAQLDWSSIEPAVLGTLFERSLDPAKRAQLGAHYTSREDILLIIEPVLMAPLRRRWATVQQQARDLAARRLAATGAQATRLEAELRSLLTGFAAEIAQVQVLDPACGSGNFLYVALKQLLDLEKEVITLAGDLAVGRFFPSVSPEQLRGIEVNEYAHELAGVTVWIGYLQWLRENGFGMPAEPILKPLDTIVLMDALLAVAADGAVSEPPWPAADVVVGNPPFLGDKKMRGELGDSYVEQLRAHYAGLVPGGADLVTYWFERARALIESGQIKRAGLLATNSIRQRGNRPVLERIKQTGAIFMAWPDRPWVLEGAAVRVSMVGFDNGSERERKLDGISADTIYADLTAKRVRYNNVTSTH